MRKLLGVGGDMHNGRHYFDHPVNKEGNVYMFSEVHLFKCCRNWLMKQKCVKVNNKLVRWSHYVCVLKQDELNAGATKVCPRARYIYRSNCKNMHVKLAMQDLATQWLLV